MGNAEPWSRKGPSTQRPRVWGRERQGAQELSRRTFPSHCMATLALASDPLDPLRPPHHPAPSCLSLTLGRPELAPQEAHPGIALQTQPLESGRGSGQARKLRNQGSGRWWARI